MNITVVKRYLLTLTYLGFRFDGVQKHPGLKTIAGLIEERFLRTFPERTVKLKFSSRTDKLVSSLESYCLLITEGEQLPPDFFHILNRELPRMYK